MCTNWCLFTSPWMAMYVCLLMCIDEFGLKKTWMQSYLSGSKLHHGSWLLLYEKITMFQDLRCQDMFLLATSLSMLARDIMTAI